MTLYGNSHKYYDRLLLVHGKYNAVVMMVSVLCTPLEISLSIGAPESHMTKT